MAASTSLSFSDVRPSSPASPVPSVPTRTEHIPTAGPPILQAGFIASAPVIASHAASIRRRTLSQRTGREQPIIGATIAASPGPLASGIGRGGQTGFGCMSAARPRGSTAREGRTVSTPQSNDALSLRTPPRSTSWPLSRRVGNVYRGVSGKVRRDGGRWQDAGPGADRWSKSMGHPIFGPSLRCASEGKSLSPE
jgi:hypothetical protein